MTSLSVEQIGRAARRVQAMDSVEREELAGEVHAEQPNLLYSVLVLQRFGVSLEQMEVVINLLLEVFLAVRESGRSWPRVGEDVQERCLARIAGRVRFSEGLSGEHKTRAVAQYTDAHPQEVLLAHAHGVLERAGLGAIRTEPEKYLVLAALNLVECVAETLRPGREAAGEETPTQTMRTRSGGSE